MKHKCNAVGRLLRTAVDFKSDVEVVRQIDFVVEEYAARQSLRVRCEREGVA